MKQARFRLWASLLNSGAGKLKVQGKQNKVKIQNNKNAGVKSKAW